MGSGNGVGRRKPEVIVFAKPAKIAGSRLAKRIGAPDAALVHHRVLSRILRHLRRGGFRVSVAVSGNTPDYGDLAQRGGAGVMLRPHGDLGRQLARALRRKANGALLIDSDVPNIDAVLVRHASRALARYDVVLGPNWSGGTYLIALRSPFHSYRVFRGIRWNTHHMLEDMLRRLPTHWRIGLLPVLADTSDAAGMREAAADHVPPRRRSSALGLIAMKRKARG